jgi:hypothetical protein
LPQLKFGCQPWSIYKHLISYDKQIYVQAAAICSLKRWFYITVLYINSIL